MFLSSPHRRRRFCWWRYSRFCWWRYSRFFRCRSNRFCWYRWRCDGLRLDGLGLGRLDLQRFDFDRLGLGLLGGLFEALLGFGEDLRGLLVIRPQAERLSEVGLRLGVVSQQIISAAACKPRLGKLGVQFNRLAAIGQTLFVFS